ncbi:MAG TPA: ATP-binding protein, partial [Jiangellaceae bacterium]
MNRSFAVRLVVAFAVVGLIAAAVTALLVNLAFGSRFTEYLEDRQDERRTHLVQSLEDGYRQAGGWDAPELDRRASVALMDGGTVRIEDRDGTLIWESQADPMAEWHRQMMGTGPLGEERRAPIEVGGEIVGIAVTQLPQAGVLPQDVAFRTSINRLLVIGAAVTGLVALLLGAGVARRATAPARALTAAARTFESGDRTARVPADRADEFGEMAQAFNRMADTVVAEDRLRRDFAADVAHELRTPLMILRGEIEALQDGVTEPTPAALASLREETLRLGRLVDDLETLARADAAGFSLQRVPTSLDAVVREVAAEYAPIFAERGIDLQTVADEDVVADVDPVRIRQVVTNLLSNAAKFTPDGGRARVGVEREAGSAVIAVWNSGPGIAVADLPHVFDRFYRGQRATASGSGIGLTVVSDLVTAHGGSVDVASSEVDGTTFTVRLPGHFDSLIRQGSSSTYSQ